MPSHFRGKNGLVRLGIQPWSVVCCPNIVTFATGPLASWSSSSAHEMGNPYLRPGLEDIRDINAVTRKLKFSHKFIDGPKGYRTFEIFDLVSKADMQGLHQHVESKNHDSQWIGQAVPRSSPYHICLVLNLETSSLIHRNGPDFHGRSEVRAVVAVMVSISSIQVVFAKPVLIRLSLLQLAL